jgi:ABC-type transport system involved in multi-copper enzyme maturation permease subunit
MTEVAMGTPVTPDAPLAPDAPLVPEPNDAAPSWSTNIWSSIAGVVAKELRWRMRGRRAYVIVTAYVAVLGLLVFSVYGLAVSAATQRFDPTGFAPIRSDGVSATASALIGQSIFGVILVLQTLLTLLLSPSLTSGAVSMEREKQTLELLITTPVSTLGLVLGKLVSSLAYVVLLILASIPLMSLAFVFGGIAPDDVVRAYVVLLATAFGMGSIGLFLSAWLKRTQLATAIALIAVFLLAFAAPFVHGYTYTSSSFNGGQRKAPPPEMLVWFSPLAADIDLICTAIPDSYAVSCSYSTVVVGQDLDRTTPPRDVLWPRIVMALVVLGVVLTLATTQLISPSRRYRKEPSQLGPDLAPLSAD